MKYLSFFDVLQKRSLDILTSRLIIYFPFSREVSTNSDRKLFQIYLIKKIKSIRSSGLFPIY